MGKRYAKGQDRRGNPDTRQWEFDTIKDQVKRRKDAFMARLQRLVRAEGDCVIGLGTKDRKGYPRMNLKRGGIHRSVHMMRVFIILRRSAPIPLGMDVGHTEECRDVRCVKHIKLQPFRENCNAYKRRKDDSENDSRTS